MSNKNVFKSALNKINELGGVPKEGEDLRIVTQKNINSFDFILLVLAERKIKNLTIAFYRIGKKTIQELKDLQSKGMIGNTTFLINDGFPKLVPEAYNLLKQYEATNFKIKLENNHTKIICIETDNNEYYVIEGSGNLSNNARIEQYSFCQNKQLYDFHLKWINKI